MVKCRGCNKNGAHKTCGACQQAPYCSRECQKRDLASHKPECKEICWPQLMNAIKENDEAAVRRLAKVGYIINAKMTHELIHANDSDSDSEDDSETEEYEDPYVRGSLGLSDWTALHECARTRNSRMMKIILDAGVAKLELETYDGKTPLFSACMMVDPGCVKLLLEAGADPNTQDGRGQSPLEYIRLTDFRDFLGYVQDEHDEYWGFDRCYEMYKRRQRLQRGWQDYEYDDSSDDDDSEDEEEILHQKSLVVAKALQRAGAQM